MAEGRRQDALDKLIDAVKDGIRGLADTLAPQPDPIPIPVRDRNGRR